VTASATSDLWRVVQADKSDLGAVEPLFRGMVEHHRLIAGNEWPVRDSADAWVRRRRQYVEWLAEGNSWLLLAVGMTPTSNPQASGYAFVRVHEPGPTWELGREVAELESLAVAEEARGSGIGTLLIERAREILRERGTRYWSVSVAETNERAVQLYRREGFRPYYRAMLAEL
jgi:ribosomal protein S18 acetylase RimI-like enzyme